MTWWQNNRGVIQLIFHRTMVRVRSWNERAKEKEWDHMKNSYSMAFHEIILWTIYVNTNWYGGRHSINIKTIFQLKPMSFLEQSLFLWCLCVHIFYEQLNHKNLMHFHWLIFKFLGNGWLCRSHIPWNILNMHKLFVLLSWKNDWTKNSVSSFSQQLLFN